MSGKAWKIALAVSLVLNVFIVGGVAGALLVRGKSDPRHGPPPAMGNPMMRAGDRLSPERREAFRAMMREQGQTARPLLTEARRARIEAADLLSQPTYDKPAVAAALAKARAADLAAREKLEGSVLNFAVGLDVADRKELAKGLRQPPRQGGGRGGRGGRDGRDGRRGPPGMGGPMGEGGPPPGP